MKKKISSILFCLVLSGSFSSAGFAVSAPDPAISSDYQLTDPRVNNYDLRNASGEVVLLPDQLREGKIFVSGRLSHTEGIDKLLFSEDGGRTWKEIPVQQTVEAEITPIAGLRYDPRLHIKTKLLREFDLSFFPNVSGIIYRDINYGEIIRDIVEKISEAYEKQDVSAFSRLLSRDYLGNRVFLEEGVRFDFDMFADIHLRIFIDRVENRGGMYLADTHWEKSQTPRKTGQQQMTTGKTVMMFSLEDGTLKIKNLRGNLLYATLSPEIAEASGLSQTVVEEIRVAEFERNPIQPGAGATINSGGVSAGLAIRNGTILDNNSFYFVQGVQAAGVGTGDWGYSAGNIIGNTSSWQQSSTDFNSLNTAPTSGYTTGGFFAPVAGTTYVVRTSAGFYCKVKLTAVNFGVSVVMQYAVASSAGSTNLTT